MINNSIKPYNLIVVFIRPHHQAQREKLNGIYAAAIEHGWLVLVADEPYTDKRLRELITTCHPLGCLIDSTAYPPTVPASRRRKSFMNYGIPVVLFGDNIVRISRASTMRLNENAVIVAALRKFRNLRIGHFAFVSDGRGLFWCEKRQRHFTRAVRSWSLDVFYNKADNPNNITQMTAWLNTLPVPTGVLLAADHLGTTFYLAVKKSGLSIGKDIFVIGVDNDEAICSSLSPSLSSVHPNFNQAGYEGTQLLASHIKNPSAPPLHLTYGVIELSKRASTATPFKDRRVGKGLAFIDEYACTRINVKAVANVMSCSRRLAELSFREHTGMTILTAIRNARISKAKSLLTSTRMPIDSIPPMCGYNSAPQMKTLFKKTTGMTMREWRAAHPS